MSKTFDALTAARHLKEAGMERPHAEAIADVVRDSREGLATQAGMEAGIAILSGRISTLQWVVGLNVAMTMAILVVMLTRSV